MFQCEYGTNAKLRTPHKPRFSILRELGLEMRMINDDVHIYAYQMNYGELVLWRSEWQEISHNNRAINALPLMGARHDDATTEN